ncbi:hypothetical protein [Escherichia coli]|uniref:hypothetical protein n=1 Tax=Escherichia coli TaxID=562 RepID=UPI00339576E2
MRYAHQALYYPSSAEKIGQFSLPEGMKKTAPDGAVSGMPAIRETGPGKNLQAITVSTKSIATG